MRWGILGPGRIARTFAAGLADVEGATIGAVGSRDLARARAFASEFGVARAHGNYSDLAADPGVDAVYVATPHAFHERDSLLCLQAGKHVLCEKPLALNARQAERMVDAARANDRLLMEALWTRFLPAIRGVVEQVAAGAIGEVRSLHADFGFAADLDPRSRLFDPALGGGALLDLGIYPLNLARMLLGAPVGVDAVARIGSTGVDEECAVLLRHDQGRPALLSCSLRAHTSCEARIFGTAGRIEIANPWWAAKRFVLHRDSRGDEEFTFPTRGGGYAHEAEAFMRCVRDGDRESAVMPLVESLAVLRTMDEIRARCGIRYPAEGRSIP